MKRALQLAKQDEKDKKCKRKLTGAEKEEELLTRIQSERMFLEQYAQNEEQIKEGERNLRMYISEYQKLKDDPTSFASALIENKDNYMVLHEGIYFTAEVEIYNDPAKALRYGFAFKCGGAANKYKEKILQNVIKDLERQKGTSIYCEMTLYYIKVTKEDYNSFLNYFINLEEAFKVVYTCIDSALAQISNNFYFDPLFTPVKEFFDLWYKNNLENVPWPSEEKRMQSKDILAIYIQYCESRGVKNYTKNVRSWGRFLVKFLKEKNMPQYIIEVSDDKRKFYRFNQAV